MPSEDERVALVAQRYSSDADAYARLFAPVLHEVSRMFVADLPMVNARVVVDAGCGAGTVLPDLGASAPDAFVLGVDLAEGMLRVARASGWGALAAGDLRALALRDACVDAVVCAFMLHHMPDPLAALREMRRVVAAGGIAATITWGALGSFEAEEDWKAELDAAGAAEISPAVANHDRLDTPEKMTRLFVDAGFGAAQAWSETSHHVWEAGAFLEWVTGGGMSRRRFESLEAGARELVLARTRERLARADAEALTLPLPVVFCVATA
jgi:ubiquinone/menaquinone biosynthesis C-methylase UbiE